MNIWIIDHYSSEPRFSGISKQYDFANGLSAKGYNVLVIVSSFSHFTKKYLTKGDCTVSEINPRAHYAYVKTMGYDSNRISTTCHRWCDNACTSSVDEIDKTFCSQLFNL